VGASAWSFAGGERRQNAPDVGAYIEAWGAGRPCVSFRERCTGAEAANETLMMGLRLRAGISPAAFRQRHGVDLLEARGDVIARLAGAGLLSQAHDRLSLTTSGMCVAEEITALLALTEKE
jgi:oxygen-independent coproporphyrinogen-3 oxidase